MEIVRGQFNWVEFVTADRRAAVDFYSHVIGWTVSEMKMQGGETYSVFEAGGRGMGGVFTIAQQQLDEGMPTGWVGYLTTPELDADVARLQRLGGKLHRPAEDIPDVGRIAPVSDPQGGGFLLMQPRPPAGADQARATGPGTLGWAELTTSDPAAAFAFYTELFGWKSERVVPLGNNLEYRVFSTGAEPGGGIMKTADAGPTHWLYYFNVAAIKATVKRVLEQGGKVHGSPQLVPTGDWVVTCEDSLGGSFALIAKKQ